MNAFRIEKIDKHLHAVPVKVGEIAKEFGIIVKRTPNLPRSISGCVKKVGGQYYIYINKFEAKNRQRYTLAHMLAHVILHPHIIDMMGGQLNEGLLYHSAAPAIEKEAAIFAIDILVPQKLFSQSTKEFCSLGQSDLVEYLIEKFKAPKTLIKHRLHNILDTSFKRGAQPKQRQNQAVQNG